MTAENNSSLQGVLVVEDEGVIRMVMAKFLRREGLTVWEAADGQAALAVYDAHRAEIDLVITDMLMPNLDGMGLTEALRQVAPDLRIVATSALPQWLQTVRERWGESVGLLPKPYAREQLLAVLGQMRLPAA
jgi:two-component system, cell cycle sensor histidine kinase and response regulator CckA